MVHFINAASVKEEVSPFKLVLLLCCQQSPKNAPCHTLVILKQSEFFHNISLPITKNDESTTFRKFLH